MAVVNFGTLKCKIIDSYTELMNKVHIGYPIEDYKHIIEGIKAIDYLEKYTIPDYESKSIVNHFLNKL